MKNTQKFLNNIREKIQKELATLKTPSYSDTLISIQLEQVRKELGEDAKNDLIDEFDLTKHGWVKEPGFVKRQSRHHRILSY